MPIYAYECSECGHAKDVLQKLSDKHLVVCPECGENSFSRQLTAAGFVLKGSGWYVTDFRDGQKNNSKDEKSEVQKDKVSENPKKETTKENTESKNKTKQKQESSSRKNSEKTATTETKPTTKSQSKKA